ncbi:type II secretion system protein [Candidatus Saccharibacteria bacterium]|nr:type II secretion system protein [Candidatus Saccharibacteria bacterium]
MKDSRTHRRQNGFSLIEILLAVGVFALFGTIMLSAFVYGRDAVRQAGDRVRAVELANGGIEVVRNIANPNYSNLSSFTNGTTYYVSTINNQWQLTTAPQLIDGKYTRKVIFGDGPNGSRAVNVTVAWAHNLTRTSNITVSTYFANWRQPTAPANKSGLFVYADGGTTSDSIKYRQLQLDGTWTTASPLPDVDPSTTNQAARSVKLFPAQTGSAKMLLTRHFNGTTQYFYATYWNGSAWGTPQLLAQWNSTSYVNVGNFGGDWLADGSFMTVYSDGSNAPKSKIFNGSSWGPTVNVGSLGSTSNFPSNIVVKARPQTNEVMMAVLDFEYNTNSNYYSNGSWRGYVKHASNSVGNSSKQIDFDWSPIDPTTGALVYTVNTQDRSLRARTFTADGQGSGSWNPVSNSNNQPVGSTIGSLAQAPRPSVASDFVSCDKDQDSPPAIYCYKFSPGPNGWQDPANKLITTSTAPGLQLSLDLAYEAKTSNLGLILYSDNTASAKLKRYDSIANSWDVNPVLGLPAASGIIQKTRLVARPNTDDLMTIVADANKNLYTGVFNGTDNTIYSSPSGKAWTNQNANGPSNSAVWFDFSWDN